MNKLTRLSVSFTSILSATKTCYMVSKPRHCKYCIGGNFCGVQIFMDFMDFLMFMKNY